MKVQNIRGYPTKSAVFGDWILNPSLWDRDHWSFDEALRTRSRGHHKPISTTEALDVVTAMLADLGRVGK